MHVQPKGMLITVQENMLLSAYSHVPCTYHVQGIISKDWYMVLSWHNSKCLLSPTEHSAGFLWSNLPLLAHLFINWILPINPWRLLKVHIFTKINQTINKIIMHSVAKPHWMFYVWSLKYHSMANYWLLPAQLVSGSDISVAKLIKVGG